jgi:hypothetical protein
MRTARIVAVFGGGGASPEEVLACAEQLGRAIAAAGHVLLTGGIGCDDNSVKGRAICGAGSARWVGVERDGPPHVEEKDGGLVIWTGLGHKRNYLEGIDVRRGGGLLGKRGTVSETTSALSLGRPVAFVGEWRDVIDLDVSDLSSMLNRMVQRTWKRFGKPTGTDGINALLSKEALLHALDHLPDYRYFELCKAEDVVEWIQSVVPGPAPFAGDFLPIEGLEEIARCYKRWLEPPQL